MIREFKNKALPQVLSGRFDMDEGWTLPVAQQDGAYETIGSQLFDKSQFELIEMVTQG